ncbi:MULTISPECIES: protein translocase subunit SecD [Streptomycetaceae]|uniref:protein translocase subunit SecD n=1 Tax=Streptomycetaceae TaxID=2062 RepID=UPI0009966AE6|nr:protein translocase subunit SecD [Streptomyces sp. BoleA5]MYX38149.1 protein translocase subunit SecD [Streptomyces sp. SID8377]
MAAPKRGRRPSGSQGYPGRALAVILLAIVALTGGMFLSGHTTPRLGIDLAGGTSITLTAKSDQVGAINKTNMETAKSIIDRRVNGLGVSEAESQIQGDRNIIVNIPKGTNAAQAEQQVGTTAQLYFRPVLAEVANTPATPASPSGSPSGSPSSPASPSATASTGAKVSGSPSASASTQGRAVTDALKASSTPSATASGAPSPNPSPSASTAAPGSALDTSVPEDLQAKLAALDCSDAKTRANLNLKAKPTDKIVACNQDGTAKYALGPAAVDGKNVSKAAAQFDTQGGNGWVVTLNFDGAGSKAFSKITSQLSQQQPPNNQFAIVLDNEVVSAPSVNQTLSGSAEIYGSFTQESSEELANVLSYGSLPLTFDKSDVTKVSAAVGGEQLHGGLIAGGVGLALVVLYLVAYYRGLSFVAILSLIVSAILTYEIMTLLGPAIGFALNLPAVCGAIVAIGITADSFIVFFERIRDELREGRSLQPAVARGWPRARRTILVSDFVSFLSAAVLFVVSVGKVQGFAFTLGLTTLLDVAVVFLFTKPLMTILARKKFYAGGHPWSGLDPRALGVNPPLRRTRRPAARTDVKEA